ncbi:MAG: type II toxin-antitoxin system death-on-curing family toxin [Gemmatimonadaceae bacterium]
MSGPRRITAQMLHLIHVRQVELFGGSHGVLDENAMGSALHKPVNFHAYEPESDLAALAAAYLCGFGQKQVFVDGNERTALAVTLTFLRLNGHELNIPKSELLAFVLATSRNELDQQAATKWLRERITPMV